MTVGLNNQSKKHFSLFIQDNNLQRDVKSRRQVVILSDGRKYSYSVTDDIKQAECRQTYEDCEGFINKCLADNNHYIVDVPNISDYAYTRTMRNGVNSYSVKYDRTKMNKIETIKDLYAKK